ncbi:uncharacterized protein LOC126837856 isoform X2 [Adelges cooleyi]|uniref:uncharacterized protein LOC126837856 isoform X2 n=1 Tax=Adelges cooleyi TaxID=133065 RepID=UPI0021804E5D|nr:uncharacterized protein LOC126837856 isoform X2 [Adelges cooleyi]
MEVIPLMRSSATGSETSNGGDNGIKRRVQEWSRLDRLTGILEHARVEADQWSNHTANTKHKYGKVVDTRARNLADGSKEQTKQTKQLEVFQAHTGGCSVQVIRSQTSTTSSWHNSNAVAGTFQWPSSIFDKREPQFDELQLEFSPLDVSSQKSKASVARSGSISNRRPPTRRPHVVTTNLPVIDLADSTDNADGSDDHRDHNADTYTTNLSRHKSCSNDEIRSETTESDDFLDRSSRFRRSLQFTQPTDVEESSHKVAGELEDVLKKVLGKKMHVINRETTDDGDNDDGPLLKPSSLLKKPSFVTVESLNKTKNGLRRLDDPGKEDDGIETDAKPAGNTRSLDYRGSALHRTEEWYNRRKSYGFEQMAADHEDKYAAELSAIDSSTDSGICHSTENGLSNSSRQSSTDRESIADLVKKYSNKEINNNNNNSPVQAYSTTVVAKGRILEAINSLRTKSNAYFDTTTPGETTALVLRNNDKRDKQQANGRRLSVDADHVMEKSPNEEESPKRHSIAVVSEVILDRDSSSDKKNVGKKVEFCRTEVHFDTTPGKINIVDMEDKPAPAQAYRPKKRYNRPPEKSNGLPEYHFGEVHGDVQVMMNGHAECNAAEDDDNNKPKSILKQCQQQQQQQQQQAGKEESSGMASDNGIEVRISSTESTPVDYRRASWSVADRVKQVEAVGFSTRVNFTEGETTAVGFDPADPKRYHRYSYNGTGSPVWYQNSGNASDGFVKQPDAKPYEPSTVPNVTSVLLIHEKQSEPSKFQPVKVHTIQTTVLNRDFDVVLPQKASKRVPVRIVQDNRKEKPKTSAPTIKKSTATVSLKQVPMTVQPKVMCQEQEKKVDKKETVYGNVGYRAGSLRIKDKTSNSRTQDLFNTGRDSWLNMPKDMGPKLNKSKVSTFKQRGRKDTMDLVEASVLEELNRAADEILKAVNGYTDDESQMPTSGDDRRAAKADETKSKNKKRAARLLQRASSREALLHLDEASSSDEEVTDESQRTKPRTQRKTKSQQINNSVATKTTTSFAKKIQSRAQTNSVTKPNNVQHKVHPTYYGNVSNNCTQTTTRFRSRTSDTLTKQSADQKENKAKYQSRITTRVFNPKKSKSSAEENRNRVKGS